MPTTVTTHQLLMECVEQWREIVSEYELKGKAENGCVDKPHVDRCVCVCV